MGELFDAPDAASTDPQSLPILDWLVRSYATSQEWKSKAEDIYVSSNADSNLSRILLAAVVRKYFVETKPTVEDVRRWKPGFKEVEVVRLFPPRITNANATYVDWLYIADYLLLTTSVTERVEQVNQRRSFEFQNALGSYKIQLSVYEAREIMRRSPGESDVEILSVLKTKHPDAAIAHVKQARRLEKTSARHRVPKEPQPVSPLPRYETIYF